MSDAPAPPPPRRGMKTFVLGQILSSVAAFLRFSILTRLIGPEQLGLAAILVLVSQFFDSVTNAGMDRFLIQDADGNDPKVQRLVHLASVGRGILTALALFLVAPWLALYFGHPALADGFRILALAPLIQGFMHYDVRRFQRERSYAAEGWLSFGDVLSLATVAVTALILRDFTAMAYGLIARSIGYVLISHLMAERPYQLGLAQEYNSRLARFGLPLMFNGLLLFATIQGDRILVASQLSVIELGHYSAVMLLIYYPVSIVQKFFEGMYLPLIAGARLDPGEQRRQTDLMIGEILLCMLAMLTGFILFAPFMIPLMFGADFLQPLPLIVLVGVLQVTRMPRSWLTTVSLANGKSHQVLTNNLIRLIIFPAAIIGHQIWNGMPGLISGLIVGDLFALSISAFVVAENGASEAWRNISRALHFALISLTLILFSFTFSSGRMADALSALLAALVLSIALGLREKNAVRSSLALVRMGALRLLGRHRRA